MRKWLEMVDEVKTSCSTFSYQLSVLHYLGFGNSDERAVCEEFVQEFCLRIESKYGSGVSIFFDWEAKVGQDILDVVLDLIKTSKYLVVLVSPSFISDDLHFRNLKSVLETLIRQNRLVCVEFLGVVTRDYKHFLRTLPPKVIFAKNWGDCEDSWATLIGSVCPAQAPLLREVSDSRRLPVFQTAKKLFGLSPGFGTIMASDGKSGKNTEADIRKSKYYDVLMEHYVLITETIEVNDFSGYLIQYRIFDMDEMAEILCERTRLRRAKKLIEDLKKKSAEQIAHAVRSMQKTYKHVYHPLMKALKDVDKELNAEDIPAFSSEAAAGRTISQAQQETGVLSRHARDNSGSYNPSLQPQQWYPPDHPDYLVCQSNSSQQNTQQSHREPIIAHPEGECSDFQASAGPRQTTPKYIGGYPTTPDVRPTNYGQTSQQAYPTTTSIAKQPLEEGFGDLSIDDNVDNENARQHLIGNVQSTVADNSDRPMLDLSESGGSIRN